MHSNKITMASQVGIILNELSYIFRSYTVELLIFKKIKSSTA